MTEKDYFEICLEGCWKMMTREDIVNSLDCNLYDAPYILQENRTKRRFINQWLINSES